MRLTSGTLTSFLDDTPLLSLVVVSVTVSATDVLHDVARATTELTAPPGAVGGTSWSPRVLPSLAALALALALDPLLLSTARMRKNDLPSMDCFRVPMLQYSCATQYNT